MNGLGNNSGFVSLARAALLIAGMAFAGSAWAEHFYAGASLGTVNVDLGASAAADVSDILLTDLGLTGTVSLTSDSIDDSDTGYKLFGGYAFNDYFAVELMYGDFGSVSENVVAAVNVTDGVDTLVGDVTLGANLDISGWGFHVVGSYPVTPTVSLFGKLGYYFYKVDGTLTLGFNGTTNGVPSTLSDSAGEDENNSDFAFGLGADYHFNQNLSGRLEWERYQLKAFDTDLDTDVIAVSLMYRF
jgi:OOP family OmpA-OmpF porin